MACVEVRGVSKSYPKPWFGQAVEALRGVDLRVPRGCAFGLIGPNGAGKTTLLKIVLGLVRPTQGLVQVLGSHPEDVRVRQRIGYLPERLHMPASFSARTFLRSIARLRGVGTELAREVDRQLERVGLLKHADERLGGYSKGMRQRAGLAAALLGAPELLVLDEPTDGIDPQGRAEVRTILREERARGATVFLNSHLLAETERLCDEVCMLVGGRVVRAGTLESVCGESARYFVRFAEQPPEASLAELGFAATDRKLVYECSAESPGELNRKLDTIRLGGALIVELAPRVRTLEEVLLSVLEERHA